MAILLKFWLTVTEPEFTTFLFLSSLMLEQRCSPSSRMLAKNDYFKEFLSLFVLVPKHEWLVRLLVLVLDTCSKLLDCQGSWAPMFVKKRLTISLPEQSHFTTRQERKFLGKIYFFVTQKQNFSFFESKSMLGALK